MKYLKRGEAPTYLSRTQNVEGKEVRIVVGWYKDLRNKDGKIRERWNNEERREKPIREAVFAISDGHCAWCGKRLGEIWYVDHYLPKEAFPRLSYYWNNLLPSCDSCNTGKKRSYAPKEITPDSLADPTLDIDGSTACDFNRVLPSVEERLVHPSEEDPARHLSFEPALHQYFPLTSVGKETNRVFFGGGQERDFPSFLAKLSNYVKRCLDHPSPEQVLTELISLLGYEFYVNAYAEFWRSFRPGSA